MPVSICKNGFLLAEWCTRILTNWKSQAWKI
jgi:hypothetical protein